MLGPAKIGLFEILECYSEKVKRNKKSSQPSYLMIWKKSLFRFFHRTHVQPVPRENRKQNKHTATAQIIKNQNTYKPKLI